MTSDFKTIFTALFLAAFLITACNAPAGERSTAENKKDTTVIINEPSTVQWETKIKDAVLDERNVIGNNRLHGSKKIDKETYKTLSINIIDSTATDVSGFKYHIVDTLFSKPGLRILLIGREYESENYAWIALYDDQNKLLDHHTVYYDNAEGFLSIETIIKSNRLTITTINDYAEEEKEKKTTELYYLDKNNRIVKL